MGTQACKALCRRKGMQKRLLFLPPCRELFPQASLVRKHTGACFNMGTYRTSLCESWRKVKVICVTFDEDIQWRESALLKEGQLTCYFLPGDSPDQVCPNILRLWRRCVIGIQAYVQIPVLYGQL